MKIIVRNGNSPYPYHIAVVSRTEDGDIEFCNHGGEINVVEITSYSINSAGDDMDDTTEYSQECARCGALYNDLMEVWED